MRFKLDFTRDDFDYVIRKFHMPRSESMDELESSSLAEREHIALPPLATQEHLINLYFAYVHPFFPVVHKRRFLEEFGHYSRRSVIDVYVRCDR